MNKNNKCCCKAIRSIAHLNIQYAHRFYGFRGEAQYLHGHTGGLTLEIEDVVNPGVNMVFPCNEIKRFYSHLSGNGEMGLGLRDRVSRLRGRSSRSIPRRCGSPLPSV